MGDFTQYDIQIECQKETVAEAVCEAISNFDALVKKHILKNDEPFDSNITDVDNFDGQVEIKLNSGRSKNAEWQVMAIIKILQEEKIYPSSFNADRNLRGEISLELEDFVEFDTKL